MCLYLHVHWAVCDVVYIVRKLRIVAFRRCINHPCPTAMDRDTGRTGRAGTDISPASLITHPPRLTYAQRSPRYIHIVSI